MNIVYNDTKKDLPVEQLYHLFLSVGWASKDIPSDDIDIPDDWLEKFNKPFINSTIVISAWDNDRLVGTVRAISDKFRRSVIYDMVVDPEYQGKGIGKELIKRCVAHNPKSQWLLETTEKNIDFYEKVGFKRSNSVFFSIEANW